MRKYLLFAAGLVLGSWLVITPVAQSQYVRMAPGGLLVGDGAPTPLLLGSAGKGFLRVTSAGEIQPMNGATFTADPAVVTYPISVKADTTGRAFQFTTNDFVFGSTGSRTQIYMNGVGNQASSIYNYTGGGLTEGVVSLQSFGGQVGVGTLAPTAGTFFAVTDGLNAASGQQLGIGVTTELVTIAAAATTTTANASMLPAGAIILAVNARVTVTIPTATSFSIGDSGSATRYGTTATIGVAANTTDAGTAAGAYYNATARGVLLTMNGGTPATNAGRVRLTVYYLLSTPPTS